ncbi:transposon Ty3-I Gag-Pol polyprotein [Trichonephila clavipes]|nr:transposon Ty3-I Gag-Pol polyprotein [Trichonephila clavipes]
MAADISSYEEHKNRDIDLKTKLQRQIKILPDRQEIRTSGPSTVNRDNISFKNETKTVKLSKKVTQTKKPSRPSKNPQTPLEWTEKAENSFTAAKIALADATLLKHPILVLNVWTDASNFAIGSSLMQISNDIHYVVGTENKVAEALSRVEIDAIIKPPILDYKKFAQTQLHDTENQSSLQLDSSIKLEKQ